MSNLELPLHPLWFNIGSHIEEVIEDEAVSEEDENAIDSFFCANHVQAWKSLNKDHTSHDRILWITERALAVVRRAKRLSNTAMFAKYVRHYTYTISWLAAILADMERWHFLIERNKSEETTQDAAPPSPLPSTPIQQMRKWEDIVSPTPAENEHSAAKYRKGTDDDDSN